MEIVARDGGAEDVVLVALRKVAASGGSRRVESRARRLVLGLFQLGGQAAVEVLMSLAKMLDEVEKEGENGDRMIGMAALRCAEVLVRGSLV